MALCGGCAGAGPTRRRERDRTRRVDQPKSVITDGCVYLDNAVSAAVLAVAVMSMPENMQQWRRVEPVEASSKLGVTGVDLCVAFVGMEVEVWVPRARVGKQNVKPVGNPFPSSLDVIWTDV